MFLILDENSFSQRAKQGPTFGEKGVPNSLSLTRQDSGRKKYQLLEVEALLQEWVGAHTLVIKNKMRPKLAMRLG